MCPDVFDQRRTFDRWHEERVHELGRHIRQRGLVKKKSDLGEAVAAKCGPWQIAAGMKSSALKRVALILRKAPYSLTYGQYIQVQRALSDFVTELNDRPRCQIRLRSRIELNLLWAE
jgi:hypothetical protein